MLGVHKVEGVVKNIYTESLSEDMFDLTENSNEKVKLCWNLTLQGNIKKRRIKYLQIKANLENGLEVDEEELGDEF